MQEDAMKIHFVQSGGVTGLIKECVLDTTTMGADERTRLEELVRESGLPQAKSGEALSDVGRDYEQYEITLEDGDRRVALVHDRSTLPQAIKPLVGFLKKCARPGKPD
jgi:Emfourin